MLCARTYLRGRRTGAIPDLLAKVKRVLQAEAQRLAHAPDLLLTNGMHHDALEYAQRMLHDSVVHISQALHAPRFKSDHSADALLEETRGEKGLQVGTRILARVEFDEVDHAH